MRDLWMHAMLRGDFEQAHVISDAVRATPAPDPRITPRHLQRVWNGTPIDGRRVLIRCHHGLGDTIQFARFLPLVADRAASVVVCAQETLLPLLRTVDARITWCAMTDDEPACERDMDVEIMELLQLFRVTTGTIPAAVPYFEVACQAPRGPSPAVGLVWRAGEWARQRSMPVTQLMPLLAHFAAAGEREPSTVHWHSLQHGAGAPEERALEEHDWLLEFPLIVRPLRPVLETACEMLALDLVISVDSMPAHLAGALGVPVWTMLPYECDWRWMHDREDSPWYPTMRLFRQPAPGEWAPVVAAVARALVGWRHDVRH